MSNEEIEKLAAEIRSAESEAIENGNWSKVTGLKLRKSEYMARQRGEVI